MSPEALKFIDTEKRNLGIMLKFMNGKVYWLMNHWRYLDPEDAQLVLLGRGAPMKGCRESNRTRHAKIIYLSGNY